MSDNIIKKKKLAFALGKGAYLMGMPKFPGLDTELMLLISGIDIEDSLPIVQSWIDGWYAENLNDD